LRDAFVDMLVDNVETWGHPGRILFLVIFWWNCCFDFGPRFWSCTFYCFFSSTV